MRRRFNIQWRRFRRESRQQLPNESQQLWRLALVTLMLALTLAAILTVRIQTTPGFELNRPSPRSIQARQSITYESEWRTEQERTRAESSADTEVYTRDASIPIQQRIQLADLLQTITQIRNDPTLDTANELDKLTSLPNSTLVISPELAAQLARLNDAEWDHVRQEALRLYDRAMNEHNYELSDVALARLRERSLPYWSALATQKKPQQDLILLFGSAFLKTNRVLDEEATRRRKQEVRDQVKPVIVQIFEGESIVREGDVVTPDVQEKLEKLGELPGEINWMQVGGKGLLGALVAIIFGTYLWLAEREIWSTLRPLLVVNGMFALTILSARLVMPLGWTMAFPLATTGLLLTALFNHSLALVATTLLSLLIVFLGGNEFTLGTPLLLGAMAGIFTLGRAQRSLTFLLAGISVMLVMVLAQIALWLTSFDYPAPEQLPSFVILSALNGSLSAILALALYNLVGHLADVITPFQLMELAHPAHPLLRKLIREAPGTYYHSIAVGNLAESAAEAIGADALLLRVASYYHDIGKTIRPYFFTDNQSDRENVHNELDPQTSAEIICEHVREGIKMARDAGLPRQIIDFIPAHHGTSVIKHFYQLALQQHDSVNVDNYRYPGPKPRTREQAIMMLADSVEATVRSKAQTGKIASTREEIAQSNGRGGKQTLEELVTVIIDERIRSGQLDESELTLQDIARIRKAFITTLQGIYHPRVDYTPQIVKPGPEKGDI